MNKLKDTKCYLVGHMQYCNGEAWRKTVAEKLTKIGVKCIDPYNKPFIDSEKEDDRTRARLLECMKNGEYDYVHNRMSLVRNEDLRICDLVDFAFCYIIPEIASWGSAEEIVTLNRAKKPLFVVIEGGKEKTPLWLMGTLKHKYFYSTIDEAVNMLYSIDNGEIEIDSNRWRLFKKDYR